MLCYVFFNDQIFQVHSYHQKALMLCCGFMIYGYMCQEFLSLNYSSFHDLLKCRLIGDFCEIMDQMSSPNLSALHENKNLLRCQ